MPAKRNNTPRRRTPRKGREAAPARPVRELLLELTYRLHATRPVATRPGAAASVA
jgi:hypothetical protein